MYGGIKERKRKTMMGLFVLKIFTFSKLIKKVFLSEKNN